MVVIIMMNYKNKICHKIKEEGTKVTETSTFYPLTDLFQRNNYFITASVTL